MSELPEGFVLDNAAAPSADMPEGFVRDKSAPATERSSLGSFARGALHGATAGWGEGLVGAAVGSGYGEISPYMQEQGADPLKVARETTEDLKRGYKESHEQHPYWTGAGEITGAGASMAAVPMARAATLPAEMLQASKLGAGYGGLSGASEGETVPEKVSGALIGAGTGAVGGAGGAAIGRGLTTAGGAALDYFGRPLAALYRGLKNPEQEAMRRVAGATLEGQENIQAGRSLGMTPQEWIAAKNAGEPVMLADLGGETGRALLRSAANTSPEGRAVINSAVQDRFEGQSERTGSFIRNLVSGGADAFKRSEDSLADYNKWRKPLYNAAYAQGDRPIWSPELERLSSIPAVADALKSAVKTGANRAGAEGYGGFRPYMAVTEDGRVQFPPGPKGIPTYPNLQFWDYAYRDLRDAAGAAFRAGQKDHGSALKSLANSLRDELDTKVPLYGAARGHAAQHFGGDNALEAGADAVKFKGDARELAAKMAKIKDPREKDFFVEGYVSELAQRIENVPDRNDITKRIFQSPQDRKRIEAVIGPQRTSALEAFMHRETIFDAARGAMGNSTTARQLIEAGLAGGSAGSYLSGMPLSFRHAALSMMKSGAQRMVGYVDKNTARNVAELLTSDDPRKLAQGLKLVASNPRMVNLLSQIAERVSTGVGANALPNTAGKAIRPMLQLPSTVAAEPNPQDIPRPEQQKKDGGAVNDKRRFPHGAKNAA